jgi:hypothetical protein
MNQKPPTAVIEAANRDHLGSFPFDDTRDFEDADRGFVGALEPYVVKAADGRVVWDNDAYAFLAGDPPASVHPSLWRQSQLSAKQGLYEVVEGIYQVRGLDLSNVSFIDGETGIIVIDPLVSTETAAAALALYHAHRGGRPVIAVIYTHSHVDHFGGVLGVTTQGDVDAGKVAIIAPEHFTQHAVQENVYAGTALARRAVPLTSTRGSRHSIHRSHTTTSSGGTRSGTTLVTHGSSRCSKTAWRWRVELDEDGGINPSYLNVPDIGTERLEIQLIEVASGARGRGVGTRVVHGLAGRHPDRRLLAYSEEADCFWSSIG